MMTNELNWKTWLEHGDQFFNSGAPKDKTKVKFGTDIRYNILSMAFEAYIMAICDFYKNLPENHTYTDLINAVETVVDIDPKLKQNILKFESIQSICSIDKYERSNPTEEELEELYQSIKQINVLAHSVCLMPDEVSV